MQNGSERDRKTSNKNNGGKCITSQLILKTKNDQLSQCTQTSHVHLLQCFTYY